MSYEGYERYLCSAGHLWTEDALLVMYEMPKIQCPICKTPPVWKNSVDQTNGCELIDPSNSNHSGNCICGEIPLEVFLPAETHTCSCGNIHESKPVRYKIPKKEVL